MTQQYVIPPLLHTSPFIDKALRFATQKHGEINQLRKYINVPYIIHPIEVANIVASVNHTEQMIAAALLHDTLEDTNTTKDEIFNHFGIIVADHVISLTDISQLSDGNRKIRKEIDRRHIALACPDTQTIKLADLINNTETIVQYDKKFAKVYLREKEYLLTVLTKGNEILFHKAANILQEAKIKLQNG